MLMHVCVYTCIHVCHMVRVRSALVYRPETPSESLLALSDTAFMCSDFPTVLIVFAPASLRLSSHELAICALAESEGERLGGWKEEEEGEGQMEGQRGRGGEGERGEGGEGGREIVWKKRERGGKRLGYERWKEGEGGAGEVEMCKQGESEREKRGFVSWWTQALTFPWPGRGTDVNAMIH